MTHNEANAVPEKIDISKYLSASGDMAIWVMKLRQSGRTEAEVDEVIRANMAQSEFSDRQDTLKVQLDLAKTAFTYPKVEGDEGFQKILKLFIKHVLVSQFANVKLNYAASDVVSYETEKAKAANRELSQEKIAKLQTDLAWMNTMGKIASDYFVKRQQGMSWEDIQMSPEQLDEVQAQTGEFSAGLLTQFLSSAYEIDIQEQLPDLLQAFDQYLNYVLVHLDHGVQGMK